MAFYCVVKIKSENFYCVVKIKAIASQASQALQHRAPGAAHGHATGVRPCSATVALRRSFLFFSR
jgi:hypothetical protein